MAGRGGKTSSLTKDQLQAMGISGKEINPSVQLPPPLFPPLVNKPGPPDVSRQDHLSGVPIVKQLPFQDNMERQYKIMWKDDFVNFLKDSPYYTVAKTAKQDRTVSVGQYLMDIRDSNRIPAGLGTGHPESQREAEFLLESHATRAEAQL